MIVNMWGINENRLYKVCYLVQQNCCITSLPHHGIVKCAYQNLCDGNLSKYFSLSVLLILCFWKWYSAYILFHMVVCVLCEFVHSISLYCLLKIKLCRSSTHVLVICFNEVHSLLHITYYNFIYLRRNIPPKEIRIKYAVGIVTLFPSLKDPYSKRGYVSCCLFSLKK